MTIVDRLRGNGQPWTFAEIIDEIERQRAALLKIAALHPTKDRLYDARLIAAAALAGEKPNG